MGFSKQESVFKTAGIGMLGGLTAAIAGQPFDTIKTRMQSVRPLFPFETKKKNVFFRRKYIVCQGEIHTTCAVSRTAATVTICATKLGS